MAGPGSTLLVAETLAGSPAGWRASVVRACRVLKAEREAVFKVLCNRMDLLQDLFSGALANRGSSSGSGPAPRVDPRAGASDAGTATTT